MHAGEMLSRVPSPRRSRLPRFRLRSLLGAVAILCVLLGLLSNMLVGAKRQRDAVATIRACGGQVWYDFECRYDPRSLRYERIPGTDTRTAGPAWLVRLVGVDFLATPYVVNLSRPITDLSICLDAVERLPHVRTLSIMGPNDAPGFESAHLDRIADLLSVTLYDYNGGETGMGPIERLKGLEVLELDGERLDDSALSHISRLSTLRMLAIVGGSVTNAGARSLAGLSNIEELSLEQTQITDSGLTFLSGMPKLRSLDVSGTRITDIGVQSIVSDVPKLQWLDVSGTGITDIGVQYICRLQELDSLQLRATSVSDSCIAALAHIPSLTFVDLHRTSVTESGVHQLKKRRPDIAIGSL